MYTTAELIRVAREIFHTSPTMVRAALESTGRKFFGLDEAKVLVGIFLNLEVKTDGSNVAVGR